MNNKHLYLISILLYLAGCLQGLHAQEKKVVEGVGRIQISEDMTMSQAKERALQEARLDALRKAGVAEIVSETSALFQESTLEKTDQLFSSIIQVDMRGEVADIKVLREEKKAEYGQWFQEVVIEATVYLHAESPDPNFRAEVSGVREVYYSGDALTFDAYPFHDAYLRVFVVSAERAELLFPNAWEKNHALTAGKKQTFPPSGKVDYFMESEKQKEVNYILFLFTKRDFVPPQDTSLNAFWRYVANIPLSEKHVQVESILIRTH
jgi:hypothetical protein